MNERIQTALYVLQDALKNHCDSECVGVNVFFNYEGYTIEFQTRTPEGLKASYISMRNMKGEFIK